jgi:hypothetical protein
MQATLSRQHLGRWVLRFCLAFQIVSLATLAALNFLDERLESVSLGSMLSGQISIADAGYRIVLPVLAYSLVLSIGLFAAGMLLGERTQRSLRNLLFLTSMIAISLALFTSWQRISWEGRRHRMIARIEALQVVCDALSKDWPKNDMNHELLGSIMAYPQWNPSTLILLTPKPIDDRFRIAAIDRSTSDVLRFQLSSGFENIWLEHRADAKLETEFTNGIEQSYSRQYYVTLSPSWFLVRYQ